MTNRPISEKAQDRRSKSPRFPPSVPLFRPWPRLVQPRSTCNRGDSAEFLGQPDEKSFRSGDVAEPIRVLVLDHFEAFKLCAVLAEPDERIVDVVHGKKEIAASRDSTTMPTLSIRLSAMCPFYNMSSVLSTNERPGGSTNNRVLSCHYVVSRCAPDALSVERYLSSRACHQWKHLLRTLRLTGSVCFYDFCPRVSSTEASA